MSQSKTPNTPAPITSAYPAQLPADIGQELDLAALLHRIWRHKWIVLGITLLCAALALVGSMMSTSTFRAEVLLAPAAEQQGDPLTSQLGGLASIAGLSIPQDDDTARSLATLQSRAFVSEFITSRDLLQPLIDAAEPREPDPPDIRDAIEYFLDDVLAVSKNRNTGMVSVAVEWHDPATAALWANELVQEINKRLRKIDLEDAEKNLEYLYSQRTQTGVVDLQRALANLIESQLTTAMLANAREEYAFEVIDPAIVPKYRVRPKPVLYTVAAAMLGMFLGVVIALVLSASGSTNRRDY